jgi:hypothetical protein
MRMLLTEQEVIDINKSTDYGAVSKGGPLGRGNVQGSGGDRPLKSRGGPVWNSRSGPGAASTVRPETATTRNSHRAVSITQVPSAT